MFTDVFLNAFIGARVTFGTAPCGAARAGYCKIRARIPAAGAAGVTASRVILAVIAIRIFSVRAPAGVIVIVQRAVVGALIEALRARVTGGAVSLAPAAAFTCRLPGAVVPRPAVTEAIAVTAAMASGDETVFVLPLQGAEVTLA